jgi:hypothetical protein
LATELINKEIGVRNVFSAAHEGEHRLSFELTRPAIEEFKDTAAAIFDLLMQQTGTDSQGDFWVRFNELNNKLENCLSVPLALEELRANLFVLEGLDPESQQIYIEKVYPEKRKDEEANNFRELRSVTGDRHGLAGMLILLVEYLNPANPQSELEKLLGALKGEKAHTWPEEPWLSWLRSWSEFEKIAEFVLKGNKQKFLESIEPSVTILGISPNETSIFCPDAMRLKPFLESMRQQLANPDLIRRLICPFKGRRRSCCGFGHHLWGIWTSIPTEYRHGLKPPSKVCLK